MQWLDREIHVGPYLYLATSEQEYRKALKRLGITETESGPWVRDRATATTHIFQGKGNGALSCIVAIRPEPELDTIDIACVLVHEATHVWQEHCSRIGETHPSQEFEAYAIEHIAKRLMRAYARTLQ